MGAQRPQGRGDLADRTVGGGQVDPGHGAGAAAVRARLPGLRSGRRQRAARASTPTSVFPPTTGRRTSAGSARRRRCLPTPVRSVSPPSSRPTRATATGRGRRPNVWCRGLPRDLRGRRSGNLRRAGPQGPSIRRPGQARSPTSPASVRPTKPREIPTSLSTPANSPSNRAWSDCWSSAARASPSIRRNAADLSKDRDRQASFSGSSAIRTRRFLRPLLSILTILIAGDCPVELKWVPPQA